jgi:hypothetical protein
MALSISDTSNRMMRLHTSCSGCTARRKQQFVTQLIDALDVRLPGFLREHRFLKRVGLGLQLMHDREIIVDDEVHDRIDDEALAHRQHLRRALAARPHLAIGGGRTVAHGHHIAAAGEDVGLAELDLAFEELGGAQRDEHRAAVDFELRTLVRHQCLVRLLQPDPQKAPLGLDRAGLREVHVRDAAPSLIGDAIDDRVHCPLPSAPDRSGQSTRRA